MSTRLPNFVFSDTVVKKLLQKHNVIPQEVMECFANGEAVYFRDNREKHQTTPPTQWFMAPTNHRRLLKVVFILDDDKIIIKTAYEPSKDDELILYRKLAKLPLCWPAEE